MRNGRIFNKIAIICFVSLVVLSGCGQETPISTPIPLATSTEIPPTNTPTPLPTSTNTPEPTPIPGIQVYPVSSLADSIPWLPLEKGQEPMTVYYGFNVEKPPFNNTLVRQAFAAAIDREDIANQAAGFNFRNVTPATSFTPPDTLGRDLYGEVGIPFDGARAKELLEQAGYSSVESFPSITLIVSTRGEAAPGAYYRMAKSIVTMWEQHLGIRAEIEVVGDMGTYINRLQTDPPEIYQLGWGADINDPSNFLGIFHSSNELNFGHFNHGYYDNLIDKAERVTDPAERQLLYIEAERILTEDEAGVIPLYHTLYYLQP